MADDTAPPSAPPDRAAALAEAYKRGILPPDMKAAYEEAMDRGLVAKPTDKFSDFMKDQAAKAPPEGAPRWDVLGDIGRSAEGAVNATGADLKAAFPSMADRQAQDAQNRKDYGLVGGIAKGAFVDPVKRMGNALKAPLDALGVVASPVVGTAHALLGSAVAAGLDHMRIPGHDPKVDADQMIDQAMVGLGPEGMEGGAAGISAAASKANALKTAATQTNQAANALRKVSNLKPGAAEAHAAGYVLPPATALEKLGPADSIASGVGGKIKLQQGASTRNQEVTNGLAAQALGLPKDTVLTDKVFKTVRDKASQAYKDIGKSVPYMQADPTFKTNVANIGGRSQAAAAQFKGITENPEIDALEQNLGKVDMFTPDTALFVVRKLRKDASANLQARDNPNKAELGLAQRKAADEVDDLIERNLTASGQKDLVAKYKAARQVLAKSHDVEGATNTATGDVSAKALARLSNRGRPFTGELKTVADTANAFPKAMQNTAAFGGDEPYSALDAGATAFAAAHGDYGAVATILGRPIVRNALLSKAYQDRMIPDLSSIPALQNLPAPMTGLALLHNTPLPGVQNQLAQGIFRAAHVNGLRALTLPKTPPSGQGQ